MSASKEELYNMAVKDCLDIVPSSDYVIVDVNRGCRIDSFVERITGKPYIKGSAFYQLSKRVLVQATKQIYILDSKTNNVYQGENARALLGIPQTNCKVEPDFNNRFCVFIQSTSLNRVLVGGTKLLILKC